MNTTSDDPTEETRSSPLALRIRALRTFGLERAWSQHELADLAGIDRKTLRTYECLTKLPRPVVTLARIARACGLHIEELLAPGVYRALSEPIDERRVALGLTKTAAPAAPGPLVLAMAIRQGVAALAVVRPERVIFLRRVYLRRKLLAPAVRRTMIEHGCRTLILETGARKSISEPPKEAEAVYRLSTAEAMEALLPPGTPHSQQALFDHLVAVHPSHGNHVEVLRTGSVARSNRGQTVLLLAAALGLAHARREHTSHSSNPPAP